MTPPIAAEWGDPGGGGGSCFGRLDKPEAPLDTFEPRVVPGEPATDVVNVLLNSKNVPTQGVKFTSDFLDTLNKRRRVSENLLRQLVDRLLCHFGHDDITNSQSTSR